MPDNTARLKSTLQALLREGYAHLMAGRIVEASESCKQILALKSDLVPGHFLVGLVALEAKDRKTAFQAFGSVTKLDPGHSAAWAHLARLFMGEGQVNRADAALQEATARPVQDPMVQDLLGTVYSLLGEYDQARRWYESAVAARPGHPPFLINLANNCIYHGDTGAAIRILQEILTIQPDNPQAHWSLAGARKARDEIHLQEMAQLLSRRDIHPRSAAFLHYASGKEREDLQQWDTAFQSFSAGAAARRQTVEYDEATEIEMYRYLEATFTTGWLNQAPAGHPDPSPIFILGQPRTGTTLIERIVSSHSAVHAAGELQQFSLAIRRLSDYRDPRRFTAGLFEVASKIPPRRLGQTYLDTTLKVRGTTSRFIDKLPQNYLCLPLILKALPQARILHLTREPMDACFASFKQLFADAYLHSYDQEEMARHHVRYHRLMDVWRERFGDRFLDVSYEDTVADLEPNARRIIEFLGLPWEPACLNFHEQTTAVSTASAVQVREPAHTRSVGRWRRYETQLAPMRAILDSAGIGPR